MIVVILMNGIESKAFSWVDLPSHLIAHTYVHAPGWREPTCGVHATFVL